jgi:hypothetical protein
MREFILPALFGGISLYAVWLFMAVALEAMFAMKGYRPGLTRFMLASGTILIIISASNVKFDNPIHETLGHLAGIFIVAPLLASATYWFLRRRQFEARTDRSLNDKD